jgi:hypothetical protein
MKRCATRVLTPLYKYLIIFALYLLILFREHFFYTIYFQVFGMSNVVCKYLYAYIIKNKVRRKISNFIVFLLTSYLYLKNGRFSVLIIFKIGQQMS